MGMPSIFPFCRNYEDVIHAETYVERQDKAIKPSMTR